MVAIERSPLIVGFSRSPFAYRMSRMRGSMKA
jgi:hypothetical protein